MNLSSVNRPDILMTSGMDEYTKANLRFKSLVYVRVRDLVEGVEHVFDALSSKWIRFVEMAEILWAGNINEPTNYEFQLPSPMEEVTKFQYNRAMGINMEIPFLNLIIMPT